MIHLKIVRTRHFVLILTTATEDGDAYHEGYDCLWEGMNTTFLLAGVAGHFRPQSGEEDLEIKSPLSYAGYEDVVPADQISFAVKAPVVHVGAVCLTREALERQIHAPSIVEAILLGADEKEYSGPEVVFETNYDRRYRGSGNVEPWNPDQDDQHEVELFS